MVYYTEDLYNLEEEKLLAIHTDGNIMWKSQRGITDTTIPRTRLARIRKRNNYKVYLDGVDVTPKNLVLNGTQDDIEDTSKIVLDNGSKHFETFLLQSLLSFKSRLQLQIKSNCSRTIAATRTSIKSEYESKLYRFTDDSIVGTESKINLLEYFCPSEFDMVTETGIILKETDTITLFDFPTHTGVQGTSEYRQVLAENDFVEYKITGKGRLVKKVESYVQSIDYLKKTRPVGTDPINFENKFVLASQRDIYDIIHLKTIDRRGKKILREEDFPDLCNSFPFQNKVQIMARVLTSNIYMTEQMKYKFSLPFDLSITNPNYSAELLLTLIYDEVKNLSVTSIDINKNEKIFAVGYGNFYQQGISKGCVGIWNIKNPFMPERTYQFENSVSVVRFSKMSPILLAIAFFTGLIEIINIHNYSKIVYFDNRSPKLSFEPISTVLWVYNQDAWGRSTKNEYLLTTDRNGYVRKYTFDDRITKCQTLRRVMRFSVEQIKGIKHLHNNIQYKSNVSVMSPYCSLTNGQLDPTDYNHYYVTTESGAILKCSRYYKNQNVDGFWAHFGPVYCMRFSPFCNSVFLTCGADSTTRVWVDGIYKPVVTLHVPLQVVQDAVWSTSHVTIIASASGNQVQVWDIARKIHAPCIVFTSFNKSSITLVRFINGGQNLLTGDAEGNICIYMLTNLPFRAFRPASVLFAAIRKALNSTPKLLRQLNRKYGHIEA